MMAIAIAIKIAIAIQIAIAILIAIAMAKNEKWQPTTKQISISCLVKISNFSIFSFHCSNIKFGV